MKSAKLQAYRPLAPSAKLQKVDRGTDLEPSPNSAKVYQAAKLRVGQAAAAKMLNVSERSIARAATVRDEAEPELKKAVVRGHIARSAWSSVLAT